MKKAIKKFGMKLKQSFGDMKFLVAVIIVATASQAAAWAQDPTSGVAAIETGTSAITQYVPVVRNMVYAIAGVVAVVSGLVGFFKMQNGDQDVKKTIMMIIGGCIFLVVAATLLPRFFGIS